MPESPEVRIFADFIEHRLKNKDITDVDIIRGRYKKKPSTFIGYNDYIKNLPTKIIDVGTKGKFMYIKFSNGFILFITLGLKGGWSWKRNDGKILFPKFGPYVTQVKPSNVEFKTDNGVLMFYDQISNGTLKFVGSELELKNKLELIGPDIMDDTTTFKIFQERLLKKKDKKIGIVLMDQKVISGLGNYLRAELLYAVKLDPFKLIKDIGEHKMKELYNESRRLTWANYLMPENPFLVYNQEKDPLGNIVKKEILGGSKDHPRYIHWVPVVQK